MPIVAECVPNVLRQRGGAWATLPLVDIYSWDLPVIVSLMLVQVSGVKSLVSEPSGSIPNLLSP